MSSQLLPHLAPFFQLDLIDDIAVFIYNDITILYHHQAEFTYSSSSSDNDFDGERTPLTGNSSSNLHHHAYADVNPPQHEIGSPTVAMNGNGNGNGSSHASITYLEKVKGLDDDKDNASEGKSGSSCTDNLKCALTISASAIAILLCGHALWTAYTWNSKGDGRIFGNLYDGGGSSSGEDSSTTSTGIWKVRNWTACLKMASTRSSPSREVIASGRRLLANCIHQIASSGWPGGDLVSF